MPSAPSLQYNSRKCGGIQACWTKRTLAKLQRWFRPTSAVLNSNSLKLDNPPAGEAMIYLPRCLPENDTAAPSQIFFEQAVDASSVS